MPSSVPVPLHYFFTTITQTHNHSTRASSSLKLFNSTVSKSLREHTLFVQGPHVWNTIPLDIKLSSTLNIFKSRLKTYLLNSLDDNESLP